MIRIDIVSGFLGAGKTTLIKKLLAGPLKGTQVVLIENEFGEIGIDGGFLKETGIEIKEMNSGCICCSLVGDFGDALKEVARQYSPDRIIIEPSGVGKLSDVIEAVRDSSSEEMEVNCATAVVDVTKCKLFLKNFGEFYKNQIEAAGTIVLSRTDLEKATPEMIDEAIALIREVNGQAVIVTTPLEELDADKLLSVMEEGRMYDGGLKIEEEHVHHHHHHDEDEEEHEHHHHHDEDEEGHEHHHHHHDEDEEGHELHDHHDEDEEGHEHHHHHHHHDHGHDADEVFDSIGIETAHKFTEDRLAEILKELSDEEKYGSVLRAKGIVSGENGTWYHFDMVPEQSEVREGPADFTGRIAVIGAGIKEDAIKALFV
ncbi:MAG: GTP-binding protein [Lachnospiraceae bacterium]|nr:GTP-binding protein [Lachnospiraceae bacterium]